MHLCESPVRENRTLGLSGGRRSAFETGASSDPTMQRPDYTRCNFDSRSDIRAPFTTSSRGMHFEQDVKERLSPMRDKY
jgi:hypothetical protein